MRFILVILIVGFAILSCKKEKINGEISLLNGEWEFLYESNIYSGDIKNHIDHTLEFKEKGKYKVNFDGYGFMSEKGRITEITHLNNYHLLLDHDTGYRYYNGLYAIWLSDSTLSLISNETNSVFYYKRIN